MNPGILCTVTAVSRVHILTASVQKELAVGWSYLFAILTFKKALFKCEGSCKYLLDSIKSCSSKAAFHRHIVDDYYLHVHPSSFQEGMED